MRSRKQTMQPETNDAQPETNMCTPETKDLQKIISRK